MRLKKLTLKNIGPYKGVNTFNLDSISGKNTILLGGKNGAGKTTLLTSVRLALYGSLVYGFRTNSETYMAEVLDILNRDHLNKSLNKFEMKLDFTLTEELEEETYSVIRSWTYDETLTENVSVLKKDYPLTPTEEDNFFELLRSEFPPSLLELCFFDGEEVNKLTSGNSLSNYLKELSHSLFNIDLFNDLEHELARYTEQTANTKREKTLQKQISAETTIIKKLSKKLKTLNEEILSKEEQINSITKNNEMLDKQFRLHGGLVSEEREAMQLKIAYLESERKKIADNVREFLAHQLPFYLTSNILNDLIIQLRAEEAYHIANTLKGKINDLPIKRIVENLHIETNLEQAEQLKEELINHLAGNDKASMIHNLSNTESQHIFSLYSHISPANIREIIEQIETSRLHLQEIRELRKLLRDNEDNSEFSNIIKQLNDGNKLLSNLENDITNLSLSKEEISIELAQSQAKNERLTNDLLRLQRKRASFIEAEKIMNVTRRFRELQLRRKVKDIEYFSITMINQIMRKQNFIKKIEINPDTFEIKLYDHQLREINTSILSAGEMQILVLCVIWGTLTAAKKQVPFIFDTMFGRLDEEHKEAIINKLIPQFGEQVIILATNSEIPEKLYMDIKKHISNEYTLHYNDQEERTIIQPGFFKRSSKEVSSL